MSFFVKEEKGEYYPRVGRIIAVVVGSLIVLSLAVFGIRWVTAPAQGSLEAREQTVGSGTFRLAAYQHFFDLCAAAQAQGDRLAVQHEQLELTDDPTQQARIQQNIAAIQSVQAEKIREYNTDATATYTQGQFQSRDLPYQISADRETGEVQCIT